MVSQTSLQTTLQDLQADPIFERFLLGRVADDVAKAIDNGELREVPNPSKHLVQIWQGRNRAPKAQADVLELLQDTLKDRMPR